jgi:hypothetical protein
VRPVAATADMTPTRIGSLVMDDVHVRTVFSVDDDDEDDEKREVTLSHGELIW